MLNGIHKGIQTIRSRCVWEIRGDTISIWNDLWIPGQTSVLDQNSRFQNLGLCTVSDLKNYDAKTWNVSLIHQLFGNDMANRIQTIIPESGCDTLKWNGDFSVKSLYHDLAHSPNVRVSQNQSSVTWKWVWKLDTIPRIQTFIWKCLHNIVPVNAREWFKSWYTTSNFRQYGLSQVIEWPELCATVVWFIWKTRSRGSRNMDFGRAINKFKLTSIMIYLNASLLLFMFASQATISCQELDVVSKTTKELVEGPKLSQSEPQA
ncbi:hypothetical protein BVC80_1079g8 [Macleaya cordata]|uniref:Reverse transcriptase zinc-binding domain n=1 Tax=Macleaya cordata TaxID=56857 RepID=A0A200PQF6_MACCD|nr:hypothetical protein BVC80_1079g8 [Macleaya cordata]